MILLGVHFIHRFCFASAYSICMHMQHGNSMLCSRIPSTTNRFFVESSHSGFLLFSSFFFKKIKKTSAAKPKCAALLKLLEVEVFADLGTPVPKKSYHHLGLSPMRPNEL